MKQFLLAPLLIIVLVHTGCAQNHPQRLIGGRCEGCEAVHESPVAFEKLSWIDTLPDFHEAGPKMVVSGVVYKVDGKTPAPNVVLYLYHTDQNGVYSSRGNVTGWAKRHGYIRGWLRTNEKGEFKFYTLRPASYPNTNAPQHIHPTIKEPGKNEYYIDDFLFDDDPNLTAAERNKLPQRGGNGILKLRTENGLLTGERNIILGKNIPDYRK